MRIGGWKVHEELPQAEKYVLVAYPHTSNWDFPLALLAMVAIGFRFKWVGKEFLFREPLGIIMRALGGIPVNRRAPKDFTEKIVSLFNSRQRLILGITPEGTRSKTEYWKTGFYRIACEASVPIALGYIDYKTKTLGVGSLLIPSGDLEKDIPKIRKFYVNKIGKHPHKQGEIRVSRKLSGNKLTTRVKGQPPSSAAP